MITKEYAKGFNDAIDDVHADVRDYVERRIKEWLPQTRREIRRVIETCDLMNDEDIEKLFDEVDDETV